MALAIYEGDNSNLATAIHQFEHAYNLISRVSNNAVRRRAILNIEAMLIAIINRAAEGDQYERDWLAASRKEINDILNNLERIRGVINLPIENNSQHRLDMNALRELFSNRDRIFDTQEIREIASKVARWIYGSIATAGAGSATGMSALSFLGGPIVGAAVTGATGLLTFSAAAIGTYKAGKKASEAAAEATETAHRAHFTYS